jgi:hypothetical protein
MMIVDFDPDAQLAFSSLAEAAYARSPIPQIAPSAFRVRGGSVFASDPGQTGKTWNTEHMFMPRLSGSYKMGEKTVLKFGYGMYFDTLNAPDYLPNIAGFTSTTANTNSTDFGQTFRLGNPYSGVLGNADPFPARADGTRFDDPTGANLGVNTIAGLSYPDSTSLSCTGCPYQTPQTRHARQQRMRVSVQRELFTNTSIEVAYSYAYSDRTPINIRQDYLPEQYWIPGELNARDTGAQANLTAQVQNPYYIGNFEALKTTDPVLYQRMASNGLFTARTVTRDRLLRSFSHVNTLWYGNLPLGESKASRCRST